MKKIIAILESQVEAMAEVVEQRNDYVDERSERWQESEKCEEYEDLTLEIESRMDDLSCLIDDLKELS